MTQSSASRDELVKAFADERILRFAYAVEQNAKLRAATERLAKMNADYVAHALGHALKESGADVEQLAKAAPTDGKAAADVVAILTQAEVLSRQMLRLAAEE